MDASILLIAILTAISTSLLGVFLVIRKMSMTTDAISHTVLLGIVFGFMLVGNLNSPILILMATLMGVFTTYLIELLVKSKKTTEDAATGVVFPLLFSIAVIIISLGFRSVHLDVDAVLLGNLEFAIFDQLVVFGYNIGPKSLYIMAFVALLNLVFIIVFYKELKIVNFDAALATVVGISPIFIHYALMFLVSLTSVAAFNAVGSILVIAMTVGPAATALLFTKDLKKTLLMAVIVGVANSIVGYFAALYFDVVISGSIATVTLITFLLTLLLNKRNGIIYKLVKRSRQKRDYSILTLLVHIENHEAEISKYQIGDIGFEKMFESNFNKEKYIKLAVAENYLKITNNYLILTDKGKEKITENLRENLG